MNLKRTTLLSAFAVAAIAAFANTASAQGRGYGRDHRDQQRFEQQEAARRAVQDSERRERSDRMRARFEQERRQFVRDYGVRSANYRAFIVRWESRWNNAVARERQLMIEQRQDARRRYQQRRIDPNRYEYLSLDAQCIERELFEHGVARFPIDRDRRPGYGHDEHDHDHRRDDHRRDDHRRDDRRPIGHRDGDPNVDWNFGIGVRVGN